LVRDDVGKAKETTYDLPEFQFSFGRPCPPDAEGVGAVISSWKVHRPRTASASVKDFTQLNRLSVRSGCATARDQTRFRTKANAFVKHVSGKVLKEKIVTSGEFAFGQPTRPSTPIYGVIGNIYGRVAAEV
jgi:hypothetical protein